jgi:hypothetical protein
MSSPEPTPKRYGHAWEDWEERKILTMLLAGAGLGDIASELGRTPNAVNMRMEQMAVEGARFVQLKKAILANPPIFIYTGD